LIGRNFGGNTFRKRNGKKKGRDQDFFIVTLSLKNLKKSFHQKTFNPSTAEDEEPKKNENGKKEDTSTKLSRNSNDSIFSPCGTRENCKNRIRQRKKS
jgi:hypothetical protein